jgi:undecaprenyl pyrophosphate phosphatase UppP
VINEYWPFLVLVSFAIVLYAVTLIWTEYVSPEAGTESPEEAETIEKLLVIKAAQILAASRQIERAHEEEKKLQLASSGR